MYYVTAYAMLIRFPSLASFRWQIWLAGNKHFTRHIYRQTVKGGGHLACVAGGIVGFSAHKQAGCANSRCKQYNRGIEWSLT